MFDGSTEDLPSYLQSYDEYLEETDQTSEDVFDDYADNMYEQDMYDYYQKLEDENKFVLIYNTNNIKEYKIPGTNICKTETLENSKVICKLYYKKGN